jgi:small neutral amino acid transporter SnatA (MarC family)
MEGVVVLLSRSKEPTPAIAPLGTHLGAPSMNSYGLIIVAAGLFSICGAAFDWGFFINSHKARLFVMLFGRTGARIVYGLLGMFLVVLGALIALGILTNAR